MVLYLLFVISSPPGNKDSPLRMLLVDCWYERHRGVVCLFVVLDGNISQGGYTSNFFQLQVFSFQGASWNPVILAKVTLLIVWGC